MLKHYFETFERDREFNTRTDRVEFWKASMPDVIMWAVLTAFYFIFNDVGFIFIGAAALYLADTFVSRLALWIRRLHDTGLKGTFAFVIFIPVLGILALLFVFMSDSQPKKNAYGPYVDPKKNIRP